VVVDGYPVVSFAVGWSRRSMIGEGENPFVGVWVPAVSDHFKNLREAVVNPIRLDREADERDLKSATNWPLYETCAVSDRWWDDPATLLLDIAAQLEALIDTFGHAVWSAARNAAVELGLS
jgi:hypothetical protein